MLTYRHAGGAAGLAVAARLSECSNTTVLLLEAGSSPDVFTNYKTPIQAAYLLGSQLDWGFVTPAQQSLNGRSITYHRKSRQLSHHYLRSRLTPAICRRESSWRKYSHQRTCIWSWISKCLQFVGVSREPRLGMGQHFPLLREGTVLDSYFARVMTDNLPELDIQSLKDRRQIRNLQRNRLFRWSPPTQLRRLCDTRLKGFHRSH